jgi:formate--tetrahydrofolate ligase
VLLKEALKPNLVQTLEGQPALVHCGPFANIASGNNSVVADLVARKLGDYLVTEGGFGSDMGFEKFCDVVCRVGGFEPAVVVLVATARTHAAHGPENLERHVGIVRTLGYDPVVAVNVFPGDDQGDVERVLRDAEALGVRAVACDGFERGGEGAIALASEVVAAAETPGRLRFAYDLDDPIDAKIAAIATRIYGGADVHLEPRARKSIARLAERGLDGLPVVMAKTHLSLAHDRSLGSTPSEFTFVVRDVVGYTGAGWLVALCGDMQTMPGLGASPAATSVDVTADGRTVGLF